MEIETNEDGIFHVSDQEIEDETTIGLRKSSSSKGHSDKTLDATESRPGEDNGESNQAFYHELKKNIENTKLEEQKYRRKLNDEARKIVSGTMHKGTKMIVHRSEVTEEGKKEYKKLAEELSPIIEEMTRRAMTILEYENSESMSKSKMYGTQFCIENVAKQDFRYFTRKNPPENSPSLVVALRIDESASMSAFGRIEAAKRAAVAVYEFCKCCNIPVLIYGDTADRSKMEQMSLFAYCDREKVDEQDGFRLMNIQPRSNNRDGMAMSILAEKLLKASEETKLMISISDGQPKAMPDYSGAKAKQDMEHILTEYRRKGINFLAAAIGQDKEIISELYGKDSFLDISDLRQLPLRLVEIITRYL